MSSYKLRRLAKALIARVDATTVKKDLNFFRAVTFVPGQTNGSELPFEILV
jgi:hypothetical protein